MQLNY